MYPWLVYLASRFRNGTVSCPSFKEGEEVFVMLRSEKSTGRATFVRALPEGRSLIRYLESPEVEVSVRSARLLKVVPRDKRHVIVCRDTQDYRYLARTQVTKEDSVVEVGCSYGETSLVLAEQASSVFSLDIDESKVEASRRKGRREVEKQGRGILKFACCNCLEEKGTFDNMLGEMQRGGSKKPSVMFIDIGGDRMWEVAARAVELLSSYGPRQIVLKNMEIASFLESSVAPPSEPSVLHFPDFHPSVLEKVEVERRRPQNTGKRKKE